MVRFSIYSALCIFAVISLVFVYGRGLWYPYYVSVKGGRSVQEVVDRFGTDAKGRLNQHFQNASVPYKTSEYWLVAYKKENVLELWASDSAGIPSLIKSYPIKAASGQLGPKLREGDPQVPEGIYRIEWLHPNSSYHLSMKLNYPNEFDLKYAKQEGRTSPGSNIFIHGKAVSIGCIAIGDQAIEELFVLAATAGHRKFSVIISPNRPQSGKLTTPVNSPDWVQILYNNIERALSKFET